MTDLVVPQVTFGAGLNIDELTTAVLNGTGTFDVLMRAVKAHLDAEFKAQRIRGADYANVYISSLTAVLGQASAYANSRMRIGMELEQLKAQTALIEAQKAQVVAETANAETVRLLTLAQIDQIREELKKSPYEVALLEGQAKHQTAQTTMVIKQVEQVTEEIKKTPVEVEILQSQVLQSSAQRALTEAQTEQVGLENLRAPKQLELLAAQVGTAEAQTNLTTQQVANAKADAARTAQETSNLVMQAKVITAQSDHTIAQTELVRANSTKVPHEIAQIEAQNILANKQGTKLEKEIELQAIRLDLERSQLEISAQELLLKGQQVLLLKKQVEGQVYQTELVAQKVITERAQTNASVIGEGSVLGFQNQLMQAQVNGYKRDAEQKLAKMLVDTWSVRRSNDDGVRADELNKLGDATIGAVVSAALKGIDVTA